MFQKRHYQFVAELLKELRRDEKHFGHIDADRVVERFAVAFGRDNPRFQMSRFLEAAK